MLLFQRGRAGLAPLHLPTQDNFTANEEVPPPIALSARPRKHSTLTRPLFRLRERSCEFSSPPVCGRREFIALNRWRGARTPGRFHVPIAPVSISSIKTSKKSLKNTASFSELERTAR